VTIVEVDCADAAVCGSSDIQSAVHSQFDVRSPYPLPTVP